MGLNSKEFKKWQLTRSREQVFIFPLVPLFTCVSNIWYFEPDYWVGLIIFQDWITSSVSFLPIFADICEFDRYKIFLNAAAWHCTMGQSLYGAEMTDFSPICRISRTTLDFLEWKISLGLCLKNSNKHGLHILCMYLKCCLYLKSRKKEISYCCLIP